MCSAHKLNKQGDNKQPSYTAFSIPNESIVQYRVLTVASWSAHTFLRRGQMVWYSHLFKSFPQFVMIHTVKGFSVVNETEVDIFLEFPCFPYDPANVDNLISGSSAFSKPSLNIWKFLVHVMLKPSLDDFKHNLTSMGDECNRWWFEHSLTLPFLGTEMRIDLFQS